MSICIEVGPGTCLIFVEQGTEKELIKSVKGQKWNILHICKRRNAEKNTQ